jgi:hypothetical protein
MADISCNKQKAGGADGADVYACVKLAGHRGIHTYCRIELVEQLHDAAAQTIEEAWAALPEGAKLNARALALAIEARAYRVYVEEGGAHSQLEAGHLEFVAEIEALGR